MGEKIIRTKRLWTYFCNMNFLNSKAEKSRFANNFNMTLDFLTDDEIQRGVDGP